MAIEFPRILKIFYYALGLSAIFVSALNLYIYNSTRHYIYERAEDAPPVQTVLILGAAVYGSGKLSPVFENRVVKALELYHKGKVSKFLVSGDNSSVYHNEVNPVEKRLLSEGIPIKDIHLDHAGFDTYSTMYRAREIFKANEVIIVTQKFHLPRAVFLARSLGLTAYGTVAEDGRKPPFLNTGREIFANIKAVWNLAVDREPKYLGEELPIN